tara:strand:- start:2539 stop:3102 length:564 start_codon:yes stop_codon:yes gene_type:complete
MNNTEFIDNYLKKINRGLLDTLNKDDLIRAKDMITKLKNSPNKLCFAGNGASASISSHASVDFTKQGGIRSTCFNESSLLTCFSNDYGYENWVAKAIEFYSTPGDIIVLISSSGTSKNILKAAEYATSQGLDIITFSGFSPDNPLRQLGNVNFWVDSKGYNIIEHVHSVWLLMICDMIVGKIEYSVV